MAATLSATGTWSEITGLDTTTLAKMNVPAVMNLNLESLKTPDGTILPELDQMIQLTATGYGLMYWQAAALLEVLLRALRNSASPMQLGQDTRRQYP